MAQPISVNTRSREGRRPLLGVGASLLPGDPSGARPLFGGKPLQVFERELLGALAAAGAEVVLFPIVGRPELARRLIRMVDGLVLAGGPDVDPTAYAASTEGFTWDTEPERDTSELLLIDEALEASKPILGVCRGAQLLNVALGGTLVRHLEGPLVHRDAEGYDRNAHPVSLAPDSRLRAWYGAEQIEVTSVHHQAVDRLGDGLRAVAWAEDGTIEAIEMVDGLVVGVQWHPEWPGRRARELPDPALRRFIESV